MNRKRGILPIIIAVSILLIMTPVFAESLAVPVNQSIILNFTSVERVAIANPDIADVAVVPGGEVVVVGKAPGITSFHIWTAAGRTTYDIEVGSNDTMIANTIKSILNYPDIKVSKVGKTVILEGKLRDQHQKSWAEKIAGAYGEKVVNLIKFTDPKQVKIEAKIIEISRDKTDKLGFTWGSADLAGTVGQGSFWFGQSAINSKNPGSLGQLGTFTEINGTLDALIKNGFAKVLSQPNVLTISGEKANILVGGEIPVPVSVTGDRISIEWKEYGIKLAIAPEVGDDNLITSKVTAEVSSIDFNSSYRINLGSGMVVPPLKSRKAETMIALPSGRTMAIGGLISSDETKNVMKVPLLGDLPILGNLFKSTSFISGKTEVVILITPTIVDVSAYNPDTSIAMKEFLAEKPWNGQNGIDQKQSAATSK